MQYFLDIALLVLVLVTIFQCWKRGFIRAVFGVAKTLIAVVLTYIFGSTVTAWISENIINARVTAYVQDRLLAMFESGAQSFDLTQILENIPSWLNVFFEKSGLDPNTLVGELAGTTHLDTESLYDFASSLAAPITKMISEFLGYSIVFFGSMIVLSILAFLLGKIADLPVIRNIDHALGLVLGVVCAILYASAFTLLVFAVFSMIEGVKPEFAFHDAYEQTIFFKRVYGINLFRFLFGIG